MRYLVMKLPLLPIFNRLSTPKNEVPSKRERCTSKEPQSASTCTQTRDEWMVETAKRYSILERHRIPKRA
jgi:hypothetical protein